jgi:hypothetical protein
MAVTVAKIFNNVCLSWHRKTEHVTFRSFIQAPARPTLFVAQKYDQAPIYLVCPERDEH